MFYWQNLVLRNFDDHSYDLCHHDRYFRFFLISETYTLQNATLSTVNAMIMRVRGAKMILWDHSASCGFGDGRKGTVVI